MDAFLDMGPWVFSAGIAAGAVGGYLAAKRGSKPLLVFGAGMLAAGALLWLASGMLTTQAEPSASSAASRGAAELSEEELREAVKAYGLYMFSKDLELSSEQLTEAVPLWSKLVEMRSEFWRGRRDRLERLRETVAGSAEDASLSEEALAFREADEAFWDSFRSHEQQLKDRLTPRQQALYIIADAEQPRRAARMYRTLRRVHGSTGVRDLPPPSRP